VLHILFAKCPLNLKTLGHGSGICGKRDNDGEQFKRCALAQKENTSFTVPNYTQIYFPYSTVTSACQGSRLACTRTAVP